MQHYVEDVVVTGRNQERLDRAAADLSHASLLAVQADAVSSEDWRKQGKEMLNPY